MKPMHTVGTPPGEYKYEVGAKYVTVGILIKGRYRPKDVIVYLAQPKKVRLT